MAYFVPLFPAAGCPLLAISGPFEATVEMSALPPKADIPKEVAKRLLMTQSGHRLEVELRR